MSTEADKILAELRLDETNLYREESYTDLRAGNLRILTPVKLDGSRDEARDVLYMAQTQLMSQLGPLPVTCQVPGKTIEEAIANYPEAVKQAIERMIEEVKEMQREQASQIVVPSQMPPGSKIQLR